MPKAIRDAFGEELVAIGHENPRVVVLDGDLATSTKVTFFRDTFPDRFFQVGIAEQNLVGIAAGLGLSGKICVVSSFSVFLSKRALDQVTISVAHAGANVKLIGAYTGILTGHTGATHQAVQDTAIMRATPGIRLVDPVDESELRSCLRAVIDYEGPVYVRLTRDAWPDVSPPGYRFQFGKACTLRDGTDLAIIAGGPLVSESLKAADELAKRGIRTRVINMSSIKPLDEGAVEQAARDCAAIVVAENHNVYGGLGAAVAEVVCERRPVPVVRVGIKDVLGESGNNMELLAKYGMDAPAIVQAAERALSMKG